MKKTKVDAIQYVTLVNEKDAVIGREEKVKAHRESLLHRAFSVLIFNDKGETLIHRRNKHKYHSGGLWTNACCSHPLPEEEVLLAASQRLEAEMGIRTPLTYYTHLIYQSPKLESGLYEHELVHIFIGKSNERIFKVDQDEVESYRWIGIDGLLADVKSRGSCYSYWFKQYLHAIDFRQLAHKL